MTENYEENLNIQPEKDLTRSEASNEKNSFSPLAILVRSTRNSLNLTQDQLGKKCNITSMYISQIENGVRIPKFRVCRSLAKALHLNEREFLLLAYRTGAPKEIQDLIQDFEVPLNDRCKKLLFALRCLPEETQEKITDFLESAISIAK